MEGAAPRTSPPGRKAGTAPPATPTLAPSPPPGAIPAPRHPRTPPEHPTAADPDAAAQREPTTGHPCPAEEDEDNAARAWGQVQAAAAPRWSAAKRARMARSFGLTLPDDSPQ
jgi:hypothetical protein